MNLGTARIVIILALVAGGVAVLANGFASGTIVTQPGNGGPGTTDGASTSPSTSASPSKAPKETPTPQIEGVQIAVFNGTTETGLAGQVQQMLEADGYVAAQDPADADPKPVPKTVIYFRGGVNAAQNRSDARYIADTYFDGARVALLDPEQAAGISDNAQVVIVVGVDYASANAAG